MGNIRLWHPTAIKHLTFSKFLRTEKQSVGRKLYFRIALALSIRLSLESTYLQMFFDTSQIFVLHFFPEEFRFFDRSRTGNKVSYRPNRFQVKNHCFGGNQQKCSQSCN